MARATADAKVIIDLEEFARVVGNGHAASSDVLFERQRQVEQEGWTPAHDDAHANREMAYAAACYIAPVWVDGVTPIVGKTEAELLAHAPLVWPWGAEWWKPGGTDLADYRRRLVKGAALAIAEIERVDRLIAAEAGE